MKAEIKIPGGPGSCMGVKFEPRDVWVGLYWTLDLGRVWRVYVCLVPCFPIYAFWWHRRFR